MNVLKNPLLSGFYPDPSVCRKGEDYFLVTSSFEYFPGIPIFHSKDFIHWHQIGHVLTRKSQVCLDGLLPSRGVYAPTIRYNEKDNRFYVITTCVGNAPYYENINFYVWADSPEGPWSDPIIIQGAEGIDPTLFFDGDDVFYLGNMRRHPDIPEDESRAIWLQKLDLKTGRLLGDRVILRTDGALYDAVAPEGPHLYHVGGWYYLLIAEGGTDHNHCTTVFRSHSVWGPYEGNPRNPVITHRNLRHDFPINSTGHSDLIELHDNSWWAVLLASRPDGGDFRNLGRETFAVPVIWEDGWPVFSPDTGHVEFSYPGPNLPAVRWLSAPPCDHFDSKELNLQWNWLRTPDIPLYSLSCRPGWLRLFGNPSSLSDTASPAFIGRRQQHMCFSARTRMEFLPSEAAEAGIAVFYNPQYYYALLYTKKGRDTGLCLCSCINGSLQCLAWIPWENANTYFRVSAFFQDYSFFYSHDGENWLPAGSPVSGKVLNKESGGGFTGVYVGMYAFSGKQPCQNPADFDWFEYVPDPE